MIKNLNTIEYWNRTYESEYTGRGIYKKDHKMSSKNYFRNYKNVFNKIIEIIPDGARVLDVACGPGILCRGLKKKKPNTKITGADFSDFIINLNKKKDRGSGIKYLKCDIRERLPFKPREKFDAIVMNEIVEHLKKPEEIIAKLIKFLEKKGLFFISVPRGKALWKQMKKEGTLGEHLRNYYHKDIRHLFKKYSGKINFVNTSISEWHILAYIKKS